MMDHHREELYQAWERLKGDINEIFASEEPIPSSQTTNMEHSGIQIQFYELGSKKGKSESDSDWDTYPLYILENRRDKLSGKISDLEWQVYLTSHLPDEEIVHHHKAKEYLAECKAQRKAVIKAISLLKKGNQ